jgi:hypothetical protein
MVPLHLLREFSGQPILPAFRQSYEVGDSRHLLGTGLPSPIDLHELCNRYAPRLVGWDRVNRIPCLDCSFLEHTKIETRAPTLEEYLGKTRETQRQS